MNLEDWALSNLLWTVVWAITRYLVVSILATLPLWLLFQKAIPVLKSRSQTIWFWVAVPTAFIILFSVFLSERQVSLDLAVESAAIGPTDPSNDMLPAAAIFVVTIRNTGTRQTGLFAWSPSLLLDGATHKGLVIAFPDSGITLPQPGGHFVYYPKEDSIAVKAFSPIPAGGIVTGILIATFPDLPAKLAMRTSKTTVGVLDVDSHMHEISIDFRPSQAGPLNFPGLHQEFR